ncbi:MAG TPA: glycosyltransferase [Actinomycetota bacterium]|nr:glycosyltransferase [Actinomycetota bacterium]
MTPLVSVVVPTRDAGRTIETCLRSIRAQTWPAVELIVVDNGSSDATWAVAERLADLALRGGPERSAQRNLGIDHAAGEWVCYVDADMELRPDVLERAVLAGETTHAVGVAIPEESVGSGFWTRCRTLERRCLRDEPDLLWPRLVRTGYLRDTGGFAPWLTGTEDAELHRRMVASGAPIVLADGLILHHEGRLTLPGLARKRFYYGRGLLAYRRAHPGALAAQARAVGRAAWRQRRRLAAEPGVAAGIAVMRAVELAAYLAGAVAGRRDGRGQGPAASRATRSASSASASSEDRSLARSDTVEGPPGSPAAPTATAERPLATGKKSSRVAPGTSRRPRLETSSESENLPTTGPSSRPHRGDHT